MSSKRPPGGATPQNARDKLKPVSIATRLLSKGAPPRAGPRATGISDGARLGGSTASAGAAGGGGSKTTSDSATAARSTAGMKDSTKGKIRGVANKDAASLSSAGGPGNGANPHEPRALTKSDRPTAKDRLNARKAARAAAGDKTNSTKAKPLIARSRLKDIGDAALRGRLDVVYPLTSKIVRIFTSSTFTDTKVERNALMGQVYPALAQYCQGQGYEFQVVDMRWGVRDEATDNHMTSELCMHEIKECQRLSTGPNFITFVAQKYGYRPPPPCIEASEFEALLAEVGDASDREMLADWFICDENAVPAHYVLQPIRDKLPHYADDADEHKQRQARDTWRAIFDRLQIVLRRAAAKALDPSAAHKYFWSVTEQEINSGILHAPDVTSGCHWFRRQITDLTGNMSSPLVRRFCDMSGGKVDSEANDLLTKLTDEMLPTKMSSDNITSYRIGWKENGVDPARSKEHAAYIERFCADFHDVLKTMTAEAITKRRASDISDELVVENIRHLQFAQSKCANFKGREELLQTVAHAIRADQDTRTPLVLLGEAGSGKSTMMAKLVDWLPGYLLQHNKQDAVLVARFVDTTSQSSTTRELLTSLCRHLAMYSYKIYNTEITQSLEALKTAFLGLVEEVNIDLILIVDSLDQLRDQGCTLADWIPETLTEKVTLILSADPDPKLMVGPELMKLLPKESFIRIPALSSGDVDSILGEELEACSRRLQPVQMELLRRCCCRDFLPLYVKLACDEAKRWKSYQAVDDHALGKTVQSIIDDLLQRVEKYHGELLVSRALGYVTLAKSGLSLTEIKDILSLDDDVLTDVCQYHETPLRRLPPLLWVRVQADLKDYLVTGGADGVQVIKWYHRHFHQVALRRYADNENTRHLLHSLLAEYFLGSWADGKRKPYVDKNGLNTEAERFVAGQPLVFKEGADSASTIFNLRMMSELPYHLVHTGQLDVLKAHVLCNLAWMYEKTRALGIDSLLDDFEMAKAAAVWDEELGAVLSCLLRSKDALVYDLGQLACQLTSRLPAAADDLVQRPAIQSLLEQAQSPHFQCLLISSGPKSAASGPAVNKLVGHEQYVTGIGLNAAATKAVTCSMDYSLRVWDLNTGKQLKKITLSFDSGQMVVPVNIGGLWLLEADSQILLACPISLNVFDVNSGRLVYGKKVPYLEPASRVYGYRDSSTNCITVLSDKALTTWDISSGEEMFQMEVAPMKDFNDVVHRERLRSFLGGVDSRVAFHRGGTHVIHLARLADSPGDHGARKSLIDRQLIRIFDENLVDKMTTRMTVLSTGTLVCMYYVPPPMIPGQKFKESFATLQTFDIETGDVIRCFENLEAGPFLSFEQLVPTGPNSMAQNMSIAFQIVMREYNVLTGECRDTLSVVGANVLVAYGSAAKWVSREKVLVPSVTTNSLQYYNLRTGEELHRFEGLLPDTADTPYRPEVTKDGRLLLLGPKPNQVTLYDMNTGERIHTMATDKDDQLGTLKMSANSEIILCFSQRVKNPPPQNGVRSSRIRVFSLKKRQRLSDIKIETYTEVETLILAPFQTVLSDDGQFYAANINTPTGPKVLVWNTASGKSRTVPPEGATHVYPQIVAYSAVHNGLVVGYSTGVVRVWSLAKLELLQTVTGVGSDLSSLWVSADGSLAAAKGCSIRNRIYAIDLIKGTKLASFSSDTDIPSVAFSVDNKFMFVTAYCVDGLLQFFINQGRKSSSVADKPENDKQTSARTLSRQAGQPEGNIYGNFQFFDFINGT